MTSPKPMNASASSAPTARRARPIGATVVAGGRRGDGRRAGTPTYHPPRPHAGPAAMSPVHEPLPAAVSFPALEEQVLQRWRERDIFNESMRRRDGAPPWVFYEGPPTANGRPGSHHVLARVFKDVFPRYK